MRRERQYGTTLRSTALTSGLAAVFLGLSPGTALAQTSGPALRYWDGGAPANRENGMIDGGDGVWSPTEPSWTSADGTVNGPQRPVPAFVIFGGAPGTVTIDDSQGAPRVSAMQFLTDGYTLTGGRIQLDGGAYTSIRVGNARLPEDRALTARIDAEITGAGGVFFNDFGTAILTGANSYQGNTRVDGGTLIGNTDSIRNNIENGGIVVFDQQEDGTFAGGVSGIFSVWGAMVKRGAGTLTLDGSSDLDWTIEQGRLVATPFDGFGHNFAGNAAIASAGTLALTGGEIAGTRAEYRYQLSGTGRFEVVGKGDLVLSGDSSGFAGHTQVAAPLRVDGALGGTITVGPGGALGGSGAVGAVTIGDGGLLHGTRGETLRLDSLALTSGATVEVDFDGPASPPLLDVAGNLVLDGTLVARGLGSTADVPLPEGVYRMFRYGGRLTDNGLALGTMPEGQPAGSLSIQTAVPGEVNLVSTVTRPLLFWDGSDPTRHDNGVVDGGPGTWRNGDPSWTGQNGASNHAAAETDFLVFAGQGGHVVLDDGAGAISAHGLQFAASGYVLSGSGLTLAGGERTMIRVGDGSTANYAAEIAVPLAGDTTLVKADAGTLILSAVNGYTGGTEVQAGTLIGNARTIRGQLANAGTVVFDQRENGKFAGDISALGTLSGTVVKRGSGDLALTGASTLDWSIEEGRVLTNAGRFTGDVALGADGAIEFASASDTRYLGTLSGTGRLVKAGAGNLALGTDSRGFTGETLVRTGSLTVEGAIRGSLTVAADAALAGSGGLGSARIDPGGRIAPGPSIATLTVTGDLVIAPGARYEVEVDPAGSASDRIDVLGAATLGGTVAHVGANGTYRPSATYTILTAQHGIQGRFDSVISTYAFLTPGLSYAPNAVTLTLQRNDVSFAQVASTSNQRAAGAALESLAAGGAYDAALTSDAATARQAFDSLSGEFHASIRTALVEASSLSRDATLERLRAPANPQPGFAMWGQALNSWSHWGSDGNAARLDHASTGALAGIEMQAPGGAFRLGMVGGHNRDELRGRGNADIDSYHAGLYAGGTLGALTLGGGAVFSWQDVAARRAVSFAGFADGLHSQYRATTAQAFGEAAYRFDLSGAALEPFATLAHVRLNVGRGSEIGSAAALELERDSMQVTYATTGLRGETGFALGGRRLALRLSAGWQHAFGDQLPVVEAALGGQRFNVTGLPIARDSLVGKIGLKSAIGDALQLDLGYSGALSRGNQDHRARAGLAWSF